MVRVIDGGDYDRSSSSQQEPSSREKALADPAVPAVLKDLAAHVAQNDREALRSMVESGAIDPLFTCAAQPLLSPVSQMFAADDPVAWLKILFAKQPEKIAEAQCPCYNFGSSSFSVDLNFPDNRWNSAQLETPGLLPVLSERLRGTGKKRSVCDIAELCPAALGVKVANYKGETGDGPLLHHLLNYDELSVAALDRLEAITGNADFLLLRNDRGETLFHRIAADSYRREDLPKLDAASWMLQKRPELVNTADRFGWTPLDRHISVDSGKCDNSMGRLLLASGAKLAKQIAPGFNLRALLDERDALDKPAVPAVKSLSRTLSNN
jgi:hypothetical protein